MRSPGNYSADMRSAHPELASDVSVVNSHCFALPNSRKGRLGEFGLPMGNATGLPSLGCFVLHIIGLSPQEKVPGIDARRHITSVQDKAAIRNWADEHSVAGYMGPDRLAVSHREQPVAKRSQACRPQPAAIIGHAHLSKETLQAHHGTFIASPAVSGGTVTQVNTVYGFDMPAIAAAVPKGGPMPIQPNEGEHRKMPEPSMLNRFHHTCKCNTWRIVR
jgi:hypothetical protein